MSNGVVKSTVVFLSEDQLLEAVARYLREPPFKFDISYVNLNEIYENVDGLFNFEFEVVDEG